MFFTIGLVVFGMAAIYSNIFGGVRHPFFGTYEPNIHDNLAGLAIMIGFGMMLYSLLSLAWKYLP